jgi:serine/threonine protein kinase
MSTAARGTLSWMAPETFKAEKYSRKGDVWGLGACLIEMVVAGDPWQNQFSSALEAMYRIPKDDVNMKIPDILSVYAKSFIELCLKRDKEERPTAEMLT